MSVKEHDQAPMGAVEANYLAQITHRFNRFVMLCCPVCGEWSLAGVGMGNRQLEDSVARVDIPAATLEAERRLLGHKGFLLLGEYGYLLTCADHGLADVHRMANPHAYQHTQRKRRR